MKIKTLTSFLAGLLAAGSASAGTVTWNGSSNATWSNGGNWTGGLPGSGDTAEFSAGSPTNQPTVTASTAISGLTLTVNPLLTINSGQILTVGTTTTNTTGSAGITLLGVGTLQVGNAAMGTNLDFGTGAITLDGGGIDLKNVGKAAINTTTGLPTGVKSLNNDFVITANGGRIGSPNSSTGTSLVLGNISLGGTLTMTSAGGGNADGTSMSGTFTLQQDSARTLRLINNTIHNGTDWLSGQIVDGTGSAGNAFRIAVTGKGLQIAYSGNSYAGGTIVEAAGKANTSYLEVLAAATLGTGNLTMESGGRIRLSGATATGTAGNLASAATITAVAGSAVGANGTVNIADRFTAASEGVYGIEGTRNYALDMSTLGNGKMFLGTITGGTYSGTLSAGSGSTYRLGGGSSLSTVGPGNASNSASNVLTLSGTNMLTGTNTLIVASGLNTNASAGRVVVGASQDFVGAVTVNTDGILATSVAGGTPFGNTANKIEVFGQLAATGVNGAFNSAILPNVTFRPGSALVFNNDGFGNNAGNNNNDRWLDSQAITLNGSAIYMQGARSSDTLEAVGAVTYNGNSRLGLFRAGNSAQDVQVTVASLTRNSGATLAIVNPTNYTAKLGSDVANDTNRLVSTATPTLLNSSTMVAPNMIAYDVDVNNNAANGAFLTYSIATGTNVPGTLGYKSAVFTSTNNLNAAVSTDIATTNGVTLASNRTVYALRITAAIASGGAGKDTITIGSGSDPAGLIDESNNVSHSAIFDFGAREAIIWKLNGNPSTFTGGIKTTGGLTKAGSSQIVLSSASSTNISGGVTINQGTIAIGTSTSATDMSGNLMTVNQEGTFNLNNFDTTVAGLSGVGNGANVTNSSGNSKILTIDFASGTQTYEGRLQGTGTAANLSLVKAGNGTQVLAANSVGSYTGNTQVNAGSLLVNGDFSGATGAVTVANLATLGGSGTIGGATTINSGGIHAPGNSPGVEKFTSDLTYADGSIFAWDIDRTKTEIRGTGYDGVNVTGTLTGLDGADAGTTFDAKFRIIIGDADFTNTFWKDSNHSWTDIFTGADGSSPKSWTSIFGGGFEYYNTSGSSIDAPTTGSFTFTGGNTLDWNFSAVPEPNSALAGLLIAAGLLRRRRSA